MCLKIVNFSWNVSTEQHVKSALDQLLCSVHIEKSDKYPKVTTSLTLYSFFRSVPSKN